MCVGGALNTELEGQMRQIDRMLFVVGMTVVAACGGSAPAAPTGTVPRSTATVAAPATTIERLRLILRCFPRIATVAPPRLGVLDADAPLRSPDPSTGINDA